MSEHTEFKYLKQTQKSRVIAYTLCHLQLNEKKSSLQLFYVSNYEQMLNIVSTNVKLATNHYNLSNSNSNSNSKYVKRLPESDCRWFVHIFTLKQNSTQALMGKMFLYPEIKRKISQKNVLVEEMFERIKSKKYTECSNLCSKIGYE